MKLAIIGAGGHARVIADAALASGAWKEVTFFDDSFPQVTESGRWKVEGTIEDFKIVATAFEGVIVGIGNCKLRDLLHSQLKQKHAPLVSIIHPSAVIGVDCKIGIGTVVLANAVINTGSLVGEAVIINTAATIDHDSIIAKAVHVSPGAHLAGQVTVGSRSWVGIGASVKHQVTIGSDVMIGAGAAVVSDVPDDCTCVGVPARQIMD